MKDFDYDRASDAASAVALMRKQHGKYLGGGTNLVDLMRENIEQPEALIDVTGISLEITDRADGGITIGAGVKNTTVASHASVRSRFPLLAEAILNGASGQIRNMATVGGNIMQRTRCYYFYDDASHCNKRCPGAGCDALEGFNRIHAILGTSPQCIATHPSDMCVALAALNAIVHLRGVDGERQLPLLDLHRLPGSTPHLETELAEGEIITAIAVPPPPTGMQTRYRKVRDRASFAFAIVSVAAGLIVEGGIIREVRLALGGVAHKPWRANVAEAELVGIPATEDNFRRAARAELAPAIGRRDNAFKIELAERVIVATLSELSQRGDIR